VKDLGGLRYDTCSIDMAGMRGGEARNVYDMHGWIMGWEERCISGYVSDRLGRDWRGT